MNIYSRFVLMGFLVGIVAANAIGAGKKQKGWFEVGCYDAMIHILLPGNSPARHELILQFHTAGPPSPFLAAGGDWEVEGERCSTAGKCEKATRAHIWFKPVKAKMIHLFGDHWLRIGNEHLSGRYVVDFGQDRIEGRFVAKYRKHKQEIICE